jgi:hypothetical protein
MMEIANKEIDLVSRIFEEIMRDINLGFEPEVLAILENPETSKTERHEMVKKVSQEIITHLLNLASSAYLGNISRGKVVSFDDVIMRLGTVYIKAFILSFSLLALTNDEKIKIVLVKGFLVAVLSKLLAEELGKTEEAIREIEVACLLMGVGRVFMHLYEKKFSEVFSENFIERCHWLIALKFFEKFNLPEAIKEVINQVFGRNCLDFNKKTVSGAGIIMLAYATVDRSVSLEGRLVISSPMPELGDDLVRTPGNVIFRYMQSIKMDQYLKILEK